jgi:uncharacterized protein YggE
MIIKQMLLIALLTLAAIVQVKTTTVPATNTAYPLKECCDNATITVYGSATVQAAAD